MCVDNIVEILYIGWYRRRSPDGPFVWAAIAIFQPALCPRQRPHFLRGRICSMTLMAYSETRTGRLAWVLFVQESLLGMMRDAEDPIAAIQSTGLGRSCLCML